jgi:hypothetical protein
MASRSSAKTPNKTAHVDEISEYVEMKWCLNVNFTLYVRYAGAVHASAVSTVKKFLRVGRVSKCNFSKVLKTKDGKSSHVFKFKVPPTENNDTQDVDASFRVYVLKQHNFEDFSESSATWNTNTHVQDAHNQFQYNPTAKGMSSGAWLKNVFNTEAVGTQLNDSDMFDNPENFDDEHSVTTPTKASHAPALNFNLDSPAPNQRASSTSSSAKRGAPEGNSVNSKRSKPHLANSAQELLLSQKSGMRTVVIGGEQG